MSTGGSIARASEAAAPRTAVRFFGPDAGWRPLLSEESVPAMRSRTSVLFALETTSQISAMSSIRFLTISTSVVAGRHCGGTRNSSSSGLA